MKDKKLGRIFFGPTDIVIKEVTLSKNMLEFEEKKREKSVTFTDHKQVNPNQTFILTAYDLYDIFMECPAVGLMKYKHVWHLF